MVSHENVCGLQIPLSARIACSWDFGHFRKIGKCLMPQSEICHLTGLQLKLELVRDKGDKLRIRGFSLGIADSIAKEPL